MQLLFEHFVQLLCMLYYCYNITAIQWLLWHCSRSKSPRPLQLLPQSSSDSEGGGISNKFGIRRLMEDLGKFTYLLFYLINIFKLFLAHIGPKEDYIKLYFYEKGKRVQLSFWPQYYF